MNRIPRTRFVTLMAAAAGVTAGLGSMAAPAEAQSRTPASAAQAADTLPKAKPAAATAAKPAAAATKATGAAKPSAAAPATTGSKPQATGKPVVSTAPYMPPENDACGEDPDCRNINGGGY